VSPALVAEPLKNFFDEKRIVSSGDAIARAYPGFSRRHSRPMRCAAWRGSSSRRAAIAKMFELRRLQLPARTAVRLRARLSFVDMTTRKHYPGLHAVELRVNGVAIPLCEFEVA
jgi:hypothetical protein